MKSYDRFVVWLDYLDSERKRSDGRKVPLNSCVRSPTLDELLDACRRLGLEPEAEQARYPRTARRQSAYVSILKKEETKRQAMLGIARELSRLRGSQPKKV